MTGSTAGSMTPARLVLTVIAWLWVLVPFAYGIWQLLIKVVPLFGG
ncbi:MFS transporter small subunit [Pseudonocardia spinosispora]|nr:hypothetical protein [Pseudonocardia spinosispora]